MGLSQFDEVQAQTNYLHLVAADGLGEVTVADARPQSVRVDSIYVSNDDAVDHVLTLLLSKGGAGLPIGSANIPAGTGVAGAPSVDFLAMALPSGATGLVFDGGCSLKVNLSVAMGGTSQLCGIAQSGVVG